jgi:hypothetical protein
MRYLDNMTASELEVLRLKGMLPSRAEFEDNCIKAIRQIMAAEREQSWDEKSERDRDLEHESRQAEIETESEGQ